MHHPGHAVSERTRIRAEEAFGWGEKVAGTRKMRHRERLAADHSSEHRV
jgi:hypothetical protein